MKRRAFLAATGGAMTTLSGCSIPGLGENGDDGDIRIETLQYISYHDRAHTILVSIENRDSTVFNDQFRTEAVPHEDGFPQTAAGSNVELGNWHEDPGRYTVRASLEMGQEDSTQLWKVHSIDCVKVRVSISRRGGLGILTASC